ncbi:17132_t:CDS:2 [Dentiscutata heterogama]|uniref:17132_t:CDS:1 n=1 Tax=Dentiscutata heterogama TaxID=1316150 RepID=A0ACA9KR65_9GLOM|nr:17132_t:CDS:2 [Dentiscutata heterogama]
MDNTVTSIFSAPVVQSRLEHHHLQQQKQLLKSQKPEARHQRSKSINKGKRGSPHNQSKESSVPMVSVSASDCSNTSRHHITKSSNFNRVDNFDSLRGDSKFPDSSFTNNFINNYSGAIDDSHLSAFGSNDTNRPVLRRSSEKRPSRKYQHNDSTGEDNKLRNGPQVTILKRPQSATDFVKSSNNNNNSTSNKMFLDITHEEQDYQLSSAVGDYSKERRRSDASSSKTRCSQRRKDVKSMTGILQVIETCNYQQQRDSNKESDVNSTLLNPPCLKTSFSPKIDTVCLPVPPQQTNNAFYFPPLNYSNAILALEEEMCSKHDDNEPSTSDNNAHTKRSANKCYKRRSDIYLSTNTSFIPENAPRRQSSTAIELQSQVAPFASQDAANCSMLSTTPPASRRPSTSPDRLMASKLYAGPTFHNSPAPSDLPLPSFLSKPSSKESSPLMTSNTIAPALTPSRVSSPSLSSGNSSDDDMFIMDDVESDAIKHSDRFYNVRKQESSELLRILSERQYNSPAAYMVPARMATSHNPAQVYPTKDGLSLTEISESLRTLLKIHGQ